MYESGLTAAFLYHKNYWRSQFVGRMLDYNMVIYEFIVTTKKVAPEFNYYNKYIKYIILE